MKKKKIRFQLFQGYKHMKTMTEGSKKRIRAKVILNKAVNLAGQLIEGEKVVESSKNVTTDPFQTYKIDKKVFT